MKELIFDSPNLGKAVNARDLWEFMGARRTFPTWIKAKVSACNAVKGKDYITITTPSHRENKSGKQRTDYLLSKELAFYIMIKCNSEESQPVQKELAQILASLY